MRCAALPAVALLLASPIRAATIHVPGDQPTIQAGLDAAVDGDEVVVACGTYYESGIVFSSGATLRSETGYWECVTIDGQQEGGILILNHIEAHVVIEGITFVHGSAAAGGAIHVEYSDATIRSCVLRENSASVNGGGLLNYRGQTTMEYCLLADNTNNVAVVDAEATFRNCTIVNGPVIGNAPVFLSYERCLLSGSGCIGDADVKFHNLNSDCDEGGDNLADDPLFCPGSYTLQPDSPALPHRNPWGLLVGSRAGGCGDVPDVETVITTDPPGIPVTVEGQVHDTPATFTWPQYSGHFVEAAAAGAEVDGTRYRWDSWSSGETRVHILVATGAPDPSVARYTKQHLLTTRSGGHGTTTPPTTWLDEGTSVEISATPDLSRWFDRWIGTGSGSYSGPDNPVTVTMNGPVDQFAAMPPIGYELTISASDTDPFVNRARPAGGARLLYLWLHCSKGGLGGLEFGLDGTLSALSFTALDDVLAAGTLDNQLLAIGGCPTGDDVDRALGFWIVEDTGGTFCLAPSSFGGVLGGADCNGVNLTMPLVTGFTSDGTPPCVIEGSGCGVSHGAGSPHAPTSPQTRIATGSTSLAPPRPNPFGRSTILPVQLGADSHLRVAVYDVTGRLVRTLVDERISAGAHDFVWGGRDRRESRVPAGVYFVRLETDGALITRKVTLVPTR